jgi:hypothetical protein
VSKKGGQAQGCNVNGGVDVYVAVHVKVWVKVKVNVDIQRCLVEEL